MPTSPQTAFNSASQRFPYLKPFQNSGRHTTYRLHDNFRKYYPQPPHWQSGRPVEVAGGNGTPPLASAPAARVSRPSHTSAPLGEQPREPRGGFVTMLVALPGVGELVIDLESGDDLQHGTLPLSASAMRSVRPAAVSARRSDPCPAEELPALGADLPPLTFAYGARGEGSDHEPPAESVWTFGVCILFARE